jgi:hypothetical protein
MRRGDAGYDRRVRLLVPARNRFIIERSRRYNHDKLCEDCQPGVADVILIVPCRQEELPPDVRHPWLAILAKFVMIIPARSYPASPRRICPLHRDEFYDTLRALDQDVRRELPNESMGFLSCPAARRSSRQTSATPGWQSSQSLS